MQNINVKAVKMFLKSNIVDLNVCLGWIRFGTLERSYRKLLTFGSLLGLLSITLVYISSENPEVNAEAKRNIKTALDKLICFLPILTLNVKTLSYPDIADTLEDCIIPTLQKLVDNLTNELHHEFEQKENDN